MLRRSRFGLTLIEVLVVTAIVGLLVGLLLPAVQSARESGRRLSCGNNIRQFALALQAYHSSQGSLPRLQANQNLDHPAIRDPTTRQFKVAGYVGTPDTWAVMLMPLLDLGNLFNAFDFTAKVNAAPNATVARTTLPGFICPSDPMGTNPLFNNRCNYNTGVYTGHGQWYAASFGPNFPRNNPTTVPPTGCPFCPANAAWGTSNSPGRTNPCCNGSYPQGTGPDGYVPGFFAVTPVPIRFDDARDGLSNTVLLGETLPYDSQHNGVYVPDSMTVMLNIPINTFARPDEIVPDFTHWSNATVEQRVSGIKSRHPGGAGVAMADGAVRFFAEDISMPLLWALGTRKLAARDVVPVTWD